jgi:hypothetical protein
MHAAVEKSIDCLGREMSNKKLSKYVTHASSAVKKERIRNSIMCVK